MLQPIRVLTDALPERLREGLGRRATGFVAALLIEALLLLLLLTLGQTGENKKQPLTTLTSFDARSEPEHPPAPHKAPPKKRQTTQPVLQPPQPTPQLPQPQPVQTPPPMIILPRSQANFSIANLTPQPAPSAKSRAAFGPPDIGAPKNTPRVGTAPDGSPLYAASWYRKPYESELRGYLSTASGPGWGQIACKTAPDYRVKDCVTVDEFPENSHIAKAVLAAAWQFKVRPPWQGGHSLVGAWVQIRIYYEMKGHDY